MPRPAYSARYLPSMLMTSGSSFAATWVASRSQYPPHSEGSRETWISGWASVNASTISPVNSW